MKQKWKLYLRQAFGNAHKNYLIIIGFTITLSLVAGLSFYVHELEDYIIKENNYNFDDLTITYNQNGNNAEKTSYLSTQVANFAEKFPSINETLEQTDLEIETIFVYNKIQFNATYNFTSDMYPEYFPNFYQMDQSFFNSPRFTENFKIVSGKFPTNGSMIMIPEIIAKRYQISLLDNMTIELHFDRYHLINDAYSFDDGNGTSFNFTLPNFIVSGIYTLKTRTQFNILGDHIRKNYYHNGFPFAPFFLDFNIEQDKTENNLISSVDLLFNNSDQPSFELLCEMELGIGILINRDDIQAKYITKYINKLELEISALQEDIPLSFSLTSTLLNSLINHKSWIKSLQLTLQYINIPVLLFSIYISSFFIHMNFKSRLDEVLLLKIRGVPFKIIRNQFVIENVINATIASVLGTAIGWVSRSLYYTTVTPYIFQNSSEIYFTQNFSFWVFPQTCLIGVLIAICASIRALKPFHSMEIAEILSELDRKNLDLEYDECTLFGLNEDEKQEINQDQIEYSRDEDERDLYNNIIDLLEKQKPTKSILKLFLATLPMGYFIFQMWYSNPNNPEWVYYTGDFINSIQLAYPFLMLAISLMTPILLTIGLIHLLVTDSPSRFARITKKIATIFLHDKAHLAGLQIIREKKFAKMIFVFALLSTLTVYSNGIINSSYKYSTELEKYQVGGDVKITGKIDIGKIQNHEDVLALENRLLAIKNEAGQPLIEDISSFYYFSNDPSSGLDYCFLNFSDYLTFLDSCDFSRTNPDLQEALQAIVQFNAIPTHNQTAILKVSQDYNPRLIQESILGKTRLFRIQVYDSITQNYTINSISTVALHHSTMFPGFDLEANSYHSYTIFDLNHFNISNPETIQFGTDMGYFLDLADDIDVDNPNFSEELDSLLKTVLNGFLLDFTIEISNMEEETLQFTPLLNDSGAFGLIYTSLIYIGGIFALALAVILVSFHQENTHITSILQAQGLSRKYVRRVMTSQIFVIFLLSCGIGGISGFLSTILFLKIMPSFVWGKIVYPLWGVKLPVYFNFPELFSLLGFIVVFSFSLFLITSKLSTRRNLIGDLH